MMVKHMMKSLWCAISFSLITFSANAVEISFGMGEHTVENKFNRLSACTVAENKALKHALFNYGERQFTVDEQSVCRDSKEHTYCDYVKDITLSSMGSIKSVLDRSERIKDKTCYVELKVQIEPAEQLQVSVDTKKLYHEGESIDVDVTVGEPLYLYIFNMHGKGIDMLFPNRYDGNSLIDDTFKFPNEDYDAIAHAGGFRQSQETLLFLFTKRRQNIDHRFLRSNPSALKELIESIPVFDRRLIQHHVVIKRGL